jgi:hypothetical protein
MSAIPNPRLDFQSLFGISKGLFGFVNARSYFQMLDLLVEKSTINNRIMFEHLFLWFGCQDMTYYLSALCVTLQAHVCVYQYAVTNTPCVYVGVLRTYLGYAKASVPSYTCTNFTSEINQSKICW